VRVKEFQARLEKLNFIVWVDDERNGGNMRVTIAEAIRDSHFFITVLTKNYNSKIEDGFYNNDWCYYEFNYAASLPPCNRLLVSFESGMNERSKWTVFIKAVFANFLYYDLSELDKSAAWKKFIVDVNEGRTQMLDEEFKKIVSSENVKVVGDEKNATGKIGSNQQCCEELNSVRLF
jgi:hypothetical protein